MPSSCLYKIAHLATKRLPYKATVFRLEHDPKSVLGAAFGPGLAAHAPFFLGVLAGCGLSDSKNVPDGSANYHRLKERGIPAARAGASGPLSRGLDCWRRLAAALSTQAPPPRERLPLPPIVPAVYDPVATIGHACQTCPRRFFRLLW
jgi:hypothetical protein